MEGNGDTRGGTGGGRAPVAPLPLAGPAMHAITYIRFLQTPSSCSRWRELAMHTRRIHGSADVCITLPLAGAGSRSETEGGQCDIVRPPSVGFAAGPRQRGQQNIKGLPLIESPLMMGGVAGVVMIFTTLRTLSGSPPASATADSPTARPNTTSRLPPLGRRPGTAHRAVPSSGDRSYASISGRPSSAHNVWNAPGMSTRW